MYQGDVLGVLTRAPGCAVAAALRAGCCCCCRRSRRHHACLLARPASVRLSVRPAVAVAVRVETCALPTVVVCLNRQQRCQPGSRLKVNRAMTLPQRSLTGVQKSSPYSITERRVPELIPVLGSQPADDVSHKPGVGCHYFPPGLQLPPQPLRGLLPISLLGEQRHNGCEQFA